MLKNIFKFILIVLIMTIIVFRLALPNVLLKFAENKINQIPEYRVKINDVKVQLFHGSYTLKGVNLVKINKKIPVPFFEAKAIKFSVEWRALLHGKLVAQIDTYQPKLNFVVDPKGTNEQLSIDAKWERAVKSLMPLNFNRIEIINGQVNYQSFTAKPAFKLSLKEVNFKIENMQNVERKPQLLSSIFLGNARSEGGAAFKLNGKFNPFAKTPTFYLAASLKEMPIAEAKNFLLHYTAINVQQGSFSLFAEVNAAQGSINGYAKPFIKYLKISAPKTANPIEVLYNGALDVISKILTNSKQKTVATQINLSGQIDDPDTSILSIIGYIFSHAFIHALLPQIDHDVKIQDVYFKH